MSLNLSKNVNQRHISRIVVTALFGHLDYNIVVSTLTSITDDLLIIYGENGSGKTTILKLLFGLLSKQSMRGTKTFIARTPFREFSVYFGDDSRVQAVRMGTDLIGSFSVHINKVSETSRSFEIKANDGAVRSEDNPIDELNSALATLNVSLYFLPDDRRVRADDNEGVTASIDMAQYRFAMEKERFRADFYYRAGSHLTENFTTEAQLSESHHIKIGPVLDALTSTLKDQTIEGSSAGDQNASSIYLRVVEQLKSINVEHDDDESNDNSLETRVSTIDKTVATFSRFGLLPTFPAGKFVDAFRNTGPADRQIFRRVLEPYLEGLEARVSALQTLFGIINTHVSTLNSFLSNKKVALSIQDGIHIRSESGDDIDPDSLSSGERQILLLLSNTILARGRSTIFIIDEPELSLNVKWQRDLIAALLKCSHGGGIQYVLASHSLELITQFKDRAVRLRSIKS